MKLKKICGARNRKGLPCQCKLLLKGGKCKFHGVWVSPRLSYLQVAIMVLLISCQPISSGHYVNMSCPSIQNISYSSSVWGDFDRLNRSNVIPENPSGYEQHEDYESYFDTHFFLRFFDLWADLPRFPALKNPETTENKTNGENQDFCGQGSISFDRISQFLGYPPRSLFLAVEERQGLS